MAQKLVAITGLLALFCSPAFAADPLPKFIFGISQGDDRAIPYMEELGIEWGRMGITWKDVEPEVERLYSLKEVMARPELVEEFSKKVNWAPIDERLRYRLSRGVKSIPVVGTGWRGSYPQWKGGEAYPDRIGRDHYLAGIYLSTRAIVERYDGDGYLDADGIVIKLWQTENELNQAGFTAAWGWREPTWFKGLVSAWADTAFLTKMLEVDYRAVHDADPEAKTMMNFHTDIAPRLNHLGPQPDWMRAVEKWKDLMDIIAFDAYPNYYTPDPVRGEMVGERVRIIKRIAPGKPVIVMEVDYPYGPAERGFTPAKQAEFLRSSFDAARREGAAGYFKFRVCDPDQKEMELTEEDLFNLQIVAPLYDQGKIGRLLIWALPRAAYVRDRFLDVLKSVEGHWGAVTPEGEKLPSWEVLEKISREVKTLNED